MKENRDGGLDLLRSIAILSVLLLHSTELGLNLAPQIKMIFSFGWLGVDLFFILSGFLVGTDAIFSKRSTVKLNNFHYFLAKRWFRTFPLYFFVLFFYVFLKPNITGVRFEPHLLPFFIFTQNYFPLKDFVQSWSICIEEQFYIILPILTFFLFPKATKSPFFWLFLSLIGIFFRSYATMNNLNTTTPSEIDYFVRFPFHTHFDGLTMGIFLAVTMPKWSLWARSFKLLIGVIGCLFLVLITSFLGPALTAKNINWYLTIIPIIFALILIGFRGIKLPKHFSFFINWVALLSYGSYLWNNLLLRFFARYLPEINWPLGLTLFLISTHILALTTYILIEKPFLLLRAKYLRSLKID